MGFLEMQQTKKAQFSEKDLADLEKICEMEKAKKPSYEQALFLDLYVKVKDGFLLETKDKSLIKTHIQLYRLDKKSKAQIEKIEARKRADDKEKKAKIEHIKFVLGGLMMSDTSLFENPKMPYFLDLLLVALGVVTNEKISKGDKSSFWVQDGNIFYQIRRLDDNWYYRILEKRDDDKYYPKFLYEFDKKLSSRLEKYAK